jgi:hypothetical protein
MIDALMLPNPASLLKATVEAAKPQSEIGDLPPLFATQRHDRFRPPAKKLIKFHFLQA